ncbi:small RNA degrading nuclease 3-like isoform X4 [Coffea eugenioides]|uniref:small RNA degrading nuclease 3-like isoform X4 n=1 Tax=Coffea eugenioides TaxID=49369 RepID=UPI000F60E52F|nr:small RNA degrading nuclease 3-like isoform X4 [Coffea eugenioides]
MDEMLSSVKKEVLVEMVKLAQKRGMKGSKGGWKEFLNFYDKKIGASLSDPSRRPLDTLLAFLKTFTQDDDLKFFEKLLECHSNRDAVYQFQKTSPDAESPEQRLVRLTLEHPQYPIDYSFPSHEEGWLVMKRTKKSKTMTSTAMVAVDCEMVLCENETEALVRVCVVDRNLQVKLNEFVKPSKAVVDYRTEITGIAAKDLDGATCSLSDIQKSMKKLLSHGTILVGHSLNNDLRALKLDHARVIDTSYIFKHGDGPSSRRLSLSNLCKVMSFGRGRILTIA